MVRLIALYQPRLKLLLRYTWAGLPRYRATTDSTDAGITASELPYMGELLDASKIMVSILCSWLSNTCNILYSSSTVLKKGPEGWTSLLEKPPRSLMPAMFGRPGALYFPALLFPQYRADQNILRTTRFPWQFLELLVCPVLCRRTCRKVQHSGIAECARFMLCGLRGRSTGDFLPYRGNFRDGLRYWHVWRRLSA